MADAIKTSTQVLVDTATTIRTQNKTMDEKLNDINREMQGLNGTWVSDAGSDIRTAMNNLKPRFEQYKAVVESYAKFLDTTAQSYEATETAVQNNAQQFM